MAVAVRAQLLQVELLLAASEPDDEAVVLPAPSAPAEAECSADEAVEVEPEAPYVAPPPIPGQVSSSPERRVGASVTAAG